MVCHTAPGETAGESGHAEQTHQGQLHVKNQIKRPPEEQGRMWCREAKNESDMEGAESDKAEREKGGGGSGWGVGGERERFDS